MFDRLLGGQFRIAGLVCQIIPGSSAPGEVSNWANIGGRIESLTVTTSQYYLPFQN